MKIDLHIHTKMSDGELTPKEVIDKAIENKVKVISITDHDTIEAYTEELIQYAENKGIKLIKGVESNYIYIDKDNNEFDECEKWNRFAKNNNLFVTVGTDFHNSDGIRPEIGFVNKRIELTEDEIDKIIENLEK